MTEIFLITFRETFQCAFISALIILHPPVRERRELLISFAAGLTAATILGFISGYFQNPKSLLGANEAWLFFRHTFEAVFLYICLLLLYLRLSFRRIPVSVGLFLLGLFIFGFEARSLGFLIHDTTAMKSDFSRPLAYGAAGAVTGFTLLLFFVRYLRNLPFQKFFSLPSLFLFVSVIKIATGGVHELEKEDFLMPIQRGLTAFLGEAMKFIQQALMIEGHSFINVPMSGLADYLGSDRTAMALVLIFLMAPPVLILNSIFSRSDPSVDKITVGAEKRYKVAFFRKELLYQSVPVIASFIILVVLIHASNLSLNPMFDPVPVPIRETGNGRVLRVPLADRSGDFSDKKIRKYVYYSGSKQIVFLALLKPDGSVGVALDECEICRPADWNVDAKGYAQRGEHLVCKYCMTPIAAATINKPGGCNPIPVSFRVDEKTILINLDDLLSTFKKVQEIEKKGTHF